MIKFDTLAARTLVTLLGSDDGFRSRFVADPVAALEQAGLMPSGAAGDEIRANASCLLVTQLASKADIQLAGAEIDRMLTSGSSQTVPALDSGLVYGKRLRAA